jgi:hypothetical protein
MYSGLLLGHTPEEMAAPFEPVMLSMLCCSRQVIMMLML